ncbi:MAG: hypothetical protein KJ645_06195 [Planctomycetes bacterium]|nr:hypothetical protein [Planctomycetota bacterium]
MKRYKGLLIALSVIFLSLSLIVDAPLIRSNFSSLVVLSHGRVGITHYNWVGAALMYAEGAQLSVVPPQR